MSRRLVVVLFLDLVGWTRLAERVDPEALQQMLEQYYEICSSTVEEHGGVVEKFIGDAVMAVFGTDTAQEDDALRALRTAFQIREQAGRVRIPGGTGATVEVHCGIAAGEALVTRSARAGVRVVGDVVNLAARLQSKAVAGEIMVNQTTAHLARSHYEMRAMEPLTLKGKAEPVPALLVTGLAAGGPTDDGSAMVDRAEERTRLRAAYHQVIRDGHAHLVTVLGPPGIGKSRLVAESLRELGAAPTVVSGTCPSYGANGSYPALVQVLDALAVQSERAGTLARADSRLAAVLDGLRSPAATGPRPAVEEVAWAARELLLAATAERPVVVVWDGLEWAGESLLRLIDELVDGVRDAPLLMVCVARPELADRATRAARDLLATDVIEVGALAPADSALLAASVSGGGHEVQAHDLGLLERVAEYSAGNPLYIKLMLESAVPGRSLDEVPATITAMVGAMLDRLPPDAQQLLGAASVIGPEFTVGQLGYLGENASAGTLAALVDRRLVAATGEPGGYRMTQQPLHEVAYRRLEKERRYGWHRRLAEHDVNPSFHLEAAAKLLHDLRPDDPQLPQLARQAAQALLAEGTDALRQRDVPAAIVLLDRALAVAPEATETPDTAAPDDVRTLAAIRLSDALLLSGDTARAVAVVTGVPTLPCRVQEQLLAVRLGQVPGSVIGELFADLADDRLARCRYEQLHMLLYLADGRFGAAERSAGAALAHARAIGDTYEEDRLLAALCEVRQWSPTPLAERIAGCAELVTRFAGDRYLLVPVLAAQARCLALTGDPAGARAALAEAGAAVDQLRLTMGRIVVDQAAGLVCALAGEHPVAGRHYRAAADALERAGHLPPALTLRVLAARELAWQDPAAGAVEIVALLDRRREMDHRGRLLCTATAARLTAGDPRPPTADRPAGNPAATAELLTEALALLAGTDDPCLRGDARFELAQAQRRMGLPVQARATAEAAVDDYGSVAATTPIRMVRAWM